MITQRADLKSEILLIILEIEFPVLKFKSVSEVTNANGLFFNLVVENCLIGMLMFTIIKAVSITIWLRRNARWKKVWEISSLYYSSCKGSSAIYSTWLKVDLKY